MEQTEYNKWQEGWYEIGLKQVQSLMSSLSHAINDLRLEMSTKTGSADQLKFFDYIYPDISQRLSKLEGSMSKVTSQCEKILKVNDLIIVYDRKRKLVGKIVKISSNGMIATDKSKEKFHPNQCFLINRTIGLPLVKGISDG